MTLMPLEGNNKNIGTIIDHQNSDSWLSQLAEANKNVSIVACQKTLQLMPMSPDSFKIFSLNDPVVSKLSTSGKLKKIAKLIERKLNKKNDDVILIDLPFIVEACENGDFNLIVETVKMVDDFILSLESYILQSDGMLMISSFYGMAERIQTISMPFGQKTAFSKSPLPLIEISNQPKNKKSNAGLKITDLVSVDKDLRYLKELITKNLE
jgi:hypothetical protein